MPTIGPPPDTTLGRQFKLNAETIRQAQEEPSIEAQLLTASMIQVPVTFVYDGEERTLIPDPEEPIRESRAGTLYVIGHDVDREAPRNFTIDKIERIV